MVLQRFLEILTVLVFLLSFGSCTPLPAFHQTYLPQELEMTFRAFTENIEKNIHLSNIEREVLEPNLAYAAQKLTYVQSLITETGKRFQEDTQVLSALNILLQLKTAQISFSSKKLDSISEHLDQMSKALKIMVETHWSDHQIAKYQTTSPKKISKMALSEESEIFKSGESHPGIKRILSSGGFVFLMLSTASDVCVITGPEYCFAVYLAGSGAVVVWLATVYRTALGIN